MTVRVAPHPSTVSPRPLAGVPVDASNLTGGAILNVKAAPFNASLIRPTKTTGRPLSA